MSIVNSSLIIKAKYILPMDKELSVIKDGLLVVAENKILAVGTEADLKKKYRAKEIIDVGNSVVMPGFINTHTHIAMSYFRGLADDLPLSDWLNKHIWPAEAKFVNADFVRRSSELACLEMIRAGIACFNDMYFFEEVTAAVVKKAGLRAMLGEGILKFPSPSAKTPDEAIKKTAALADEYKNEEFITIAFAPHSVYACAEEHLVRIKELAEKLDL